MGKRNPLKHPELFARLNPLFETQLKAVKESGTYAKDARPTTTALLAPMRKKARAEDSRAQQLTKEETAQMAQYYRNVFGEDKIFKSSKLLAAEKEAVKAAIAAQEREKAGLDLMEALNQKDEDAAGDDDDEESS